MENEKDTQIQTEELQGLERLQNRKKLKKIRLFAIIGAVLLIFLIFLISLSLKKGTVTVTIPKGSSSMKIAEILKENDIIESKFLFIAGLKLSDYDGKLNFGTFELDKGDSYSKIYETLATVGARKATVTLTIPEGFSVEKIKTEVVRLGLCSEDEFEEALKKDYDYPFLKDTPQNSDIKYRLQGYLYPSTYELYSDATAETIIKTMLDEFQKQTANLNITDYHYTVTLASLVEREAKLDSERELIAGVMNNRLNINMPLQIDATVVYALSNGMYDVPRVYFNDYKLDSPYNTYENSGLPIGPICSPSIKSLNAVLNSAKHNFLYYHTDNAKNDGSHIFTETFQEHINTKN